MQRLEKEKRLRKVEWEQDQAQLSRRGLPTGFLLLEEGR